MKKTKFSILITTVLTLITLTLAAGVCSCGHNGNVSDNTSENHDTSVTAPTETEGTHSASDGYLHITNGGASDFRIVYPYGSDDDVKAAATALRNGIENATAAKLPIRTDTGETYDREILVGLTARPESRELYDSLDELTFAIQTTENKVAVAGSNIQMLEAAVTFFLDNYMKGRELNLAAGTLFVSEKQPASPANVIVRDGKYYFSAEQIAELAAPDDVRKVLKSGCVGGGSVYVTFSSGMPDEATGKFGTAVVRYSLSDGSKIAHGEVFQSGAVSDMTYVTDGSAQPVAAIYGGSSPDTLARMTEGMLRITSEDRLPSGVRAICYAGLGKFYAVGETSGELLTLGETLGVESRISLSGKLGGTVRSAAFDGRYVYILTSSPNRIAVVSPETGFVTEIPLGFTTREPRGIGLCETGFYVIFVDPLWNGGELYRFDLHVSEQ